MDFLTLIFRNIRRHPIRSVLTVSGVTIALFAFIMIHTLIDAWYAGVRSSARDRLITRNSVSLVFYMPIAYGRSIAQVPGVTEITSGNWFGGIYKDERNRFAQFAVDDNYFNVYPEYLLTPEEIRNYQADRKGVIIGEELADRFNLKVGDIMQLQGTIFPGQWELNVRGVYRSNSDNAVTRSIYFHWDYLNERNKQEIQRQPDQVGFYAVRLAPGADPSVVAKQIDALFANSFAETLTESETAFQQSFVSMSTAIIIALKAISAVVILIMLLVVTNTMLMSSRERHREYAVLKALGFSDSKIGSLIIGEAALLCAIGLLLLGLLLVPIFSVPPKVILGDLINFFPVFRLTFINLLWCLALAIAIAVTAGLLPYRAMKRLSVMEGLRSA